MILVVGCFSNQFLSQVISVSTNSLSSQTTCEDAPSSATTFTISGSSLTNDISITLNNTNYIEVSDDGTTYYTSLSLTQSAGNVAATTIYARIKSKSGLSNDVSGINCDITCSSDGATAEVVTFNGNAIDNSPP